MCDCLLHTPTWGPGPQPRHVPWLGIELATLWFTDRHSIHWATPARAKDQLLKITSFLYSSSNGLDKCHNWKDMHITAIKTIKYHKFQLRLCVLVNMSEYLFFLLGQFAFWVNRFHITFPLFHYFAATSSPELHILTCFNEVAYPFPVPSHRIGIPTITIL